MISDVQREVFKRFFDNRSELISSYEAGDITKKEFLEHNYHFVRRLQLRPFVRITCFEKGLYNYQYYNGLAKYYRIMAKELKANKNYKRNYNQYINKVNHYYDEKDKTVLDLISLLDFKDMDAYYIEMESKGLDNKLYEIVLNNYKEAIFHSKSPTLLKTLKENGVFKEGKHQSKIAEYINERY